MREPLLPEGLEVSGQGVPLLDLVSVFIPEDSGIYKSLLEACLKNLEYGGRGIRNVVERDLITPLSREISRGKIRAGSTVVLRELRAECHQKYIDYEIS